MTHLAGSDPLPPPELLPLSPVQTEIWLEQCKHPESSVFLLAMHYTIPAAIDAVRLRRAIDEVLRSQEAMFMRLHAGTDGIPRVSFDPANAIACQWLDLSADADPQAALARHAERSTSAPFTLIGEPLCRAFLYKLGERDYSFLCVAHHISNDAWGMGTLFPRIKARYEELQSRPESPAPGRGHTFSEYVRTGGGTPSSDYVARATSFWAGLPKRRPVFTPRHPIGPGGEQACQRIQFPLPREQARRLAHLADGITLYHVVLLAWTLLLRRMYGHECSVLNLPVLNRGKDRKDVPGLFVATHALPIPHDDNASIADNLTAIARRIRDYFRHYNLPSSETARLTAPEGEPPPPAASTASAVSYITRDYQAELDGVYLGMVSRWKQHEGLPILLYLLDLYPDRDIECDLLHQLRFASPAEAALIPARFSWVLRQIEEQPGRPLGQIDLIPPEERARIQAALDNRHAAPSPTRPVLEDLLALAVRQPHAIAVEEADGRQHTYAELVARARSIAHALRTQGVGPGGRVLLQLPRSADFIAAMLGTWWCGAAYVPMDPTAPERRARAIGEACSATCLLSNAALQAHAAAIHERVLIVDTIADHRESAPAQTSLDGLAYLIFTSGSTGAPKGVMIAHSALAAHLASVCLKIPADEADERVAFFHSPAFDASIEVVLSTLLRGGTLVCAPHPQWPPHEIARIVVARRITRLFLTQAYAHEMLRHMQEHPDSLAGHQVSACIMGGEALPSEIAALRDTVFGPHTRFYNAYGPTETTISATYFEIPPGFQNEPGDSIPIGPPLAGRHLRIVDAQDRDVPIGTDGELLIGGLSLAEGYCRLPEETARRFPTLPGFGRCYRSGDIVRLRPDGQLVFVHRTDEQVKIRGFRIELAEIESALASHPAVLNAAVIAPADAHGARTLHAFVAPRDGRVIDLQTLRQHLGRSLPDYMIPRLHSLATLPKTPAGKIDRQALGRLSLETLPEPSTAGHAPSGPVQEYLAHLWTETLGHPVTDIDADFFELGGHSLLAARLIAAMGKAFRVDYPFAEFFGNPTLAHCQRRLETLVGDKTRLEKMAVLRLELLGLSPQEIKTRLAALRQ